MIVPKKEAKSFGIVHIDKNLNFTGFCKELNKEDSVLVDVYINDEKIDTIISNQYSKELDNVYDCGNNCFNYELNDKKTQFDSIIHFKNHSSNEDLNNSPIQLSKVGTIHKLIFNKNLEKEILDVTIIEEYQKDNIGFIANDRNLEDKTFIDYISKLLEKLPYIKVKAFYFDDNQKEKLNNLFKDYENFDILIPTCIAEIASNIEIFIWNLEDQEDYRLLKLLMKKSTNVFFLYNYANPKLYDLEKLKLCDFDKILDESNHPLLERPLEFGFTQEEVELYGHSYHSLIFNSFFKRENILDEEINLENEALEFLQFKQIELILKYQKLKELNLEINTRSNTL